MERGLGKNELDIRVFKTIFRPDRLAYEKYPVCLYVGYPAGYQIQYPATKTENPCPLLTHRKHNIGLTSDVYISRKKNQKADLILFITSLAKESMYNFYICSYNA